MCRAKDPLHNEEIAHKVKNYRNTIRKLTRKSKAKHINKYFHDNKLNVFKLWEGIREIINISKKESNNSNYIQIRKKLFPAHLTLQINLIDILFKLPSK